MMKIKEKMQQYVAKMQRNAAKIRQNAIKIWRKIPATARGALHSAWQLIKRFTPRLNFDPWKQQDILAKKFGWARFYSIYIPAFIATTFTFSNPLVKIIFSIIGLSHIIKPASSTPVSTAGVIAASIAIGSIAFFFPLVEDILAVLGAGFLIVDAMYWIWYYYEEYKIKHGEVTYAA